jgi:trimeric autotransporter adhesin
MRHSLTLILLSLLTVTLAFSPACKGNTPASLEPEGSLLQINIFNAPSQLNPGQVFAVGARGIYSGTATYVITPYADWLSSNTGIIQIIGKGILRPVAPGTVNISCTYKGVTSAPIQIVVSGPALPGTGNPPQVYLASIQVEPTWASVPIGGTYQFEATAIYSNGSNQNITTLADWRVSDDKPGFIIDSDNIGVWGLNYGLFRATGPVGTTVVSCAYAGVVSNYVTVVVKQF